MFLETAVSTLHLCGDNIELTALHWAWHSLSIVNRTASAPPVVDLDYHMHFRKGCLTTFVDVIRQKTQGKYGVRKGLAPPLVLWIPAAAADASIAEARVRKLPEGTASYGSLKPGSEIVLPSTCAIAAAVEASLRCHCMTHLTAHTSYCHACPLPTLPVIWADLS